MLHEEYPEMTIGSVDGLQGQEREVSELVSIPYLSKFHLREPDLTDTELRQSSSLWFAPIPLAK
jgi:hypothetical protein